MDAEILNGKKVHRSTSEDHYQTETESFNLTDVGVSEEHINGLLGILTTEAWNVLLHNFVLPCLAFITILICFGWLLTSKENSLIQLLFYSSGVYVALMMAFTLYAVENFSDNSMRGVSS